jgi:hypothetical protein
MPLSDEAGSRTSAPATLTVTPGPCAITGHVRTSAGAGIPGVTVSARDGGAAVTDADGYYALLVPDNWSGTVTPALTDHTFSPTSRDYSHLTEDQTSQDDTGTHWVAWQMVSAHGVAEPAVGVYTNVYGAVLTNTVSATETVGLTQYVCTGWSMSGQQPARGTANWLVVTQTNNAVLAWRWRTNYWLETKAGAHGSLDLANQWVVGGASATVRAIPERYYHFTEWSGVADSQANPLTLTMDQPRAVTAFFEPDRTAQSTPHEWLASYGLTNQDWELEAAADEDGDGAFTWQEYPADTHPTDGQSVLRLRRLRAAPEGMEVERQGGTAATQYREVRSDWGGPGGGWQLRLTNTPSFYRLRVER